MTEDFLKGNQSIKDFLMRAIELMQKEDTDLVEMKMTLPDGTVVEFELVVTNVIRPKTDPL
ncbi:MAG: hypothetical protein AB1560_01920 [Pseudomonadota bacterium]